MIIISHHYKWSYVPITGACSSNYRTCLFKIISGTTGLLKVLALGFLFLFLFLRKSCFPLLHKRFSQLSPEVNTHLLAHDFVGQKSSTVRHGSLLSITRPQLKCWPSWVFFCRLCRQSTSKLIHTVDRMQLLSFVGLKPSFSCRLSATACFQLLEATLVFMLSFWSHKGTRNSSNMTSFTSDFQT